jgi:hypothetical protein
MLSIVRVCGGGLGDCQGTRAFRGEGFGDLSSFSFQLWGERHGNRMGRARGWGRLMLVPLRLSTPSLTTDAHPVALTASLCAQARSPRCCVADGRGHHRIAAHGASEDQSRFGSCGGRDARDRWCAAQLGGSVECVRAGQELEGHVRAVARVSQ